MNSVIPTMFIIEDNQQTARLFHDMFRHSQMNLVMLQSSDLHQLGDLIDSYQPIVVIMDYMSIIYDYDHIVNLIPLHIPTVLLTAIEDNKFQTSVDYCIKKPFAPSQLYTLLNEISREIT